jgi:di/tricarboxylate transporter
MATTFAGNLTLLGSVANLIVAEIARRQGVELSFREYLKAGVPITLVSLVLGILWLSLTGKTGETAVAHVAASSSARKAARGSPS